jgi:hypothetical protein
VVSHSAAVEAFMRVRGLAAGASNKNN